MLKLEYLFDMILKLEIENLNCDYFIWNADVFGNFCREESSEAILQALRDETLNDPRERIEIAQTHSFYRPSLLGQPS